MRKLTMFNFVSLNGFFKGPKGDISWAHGDKETDDYAIESARSGGMLLFGRVTYELMAGFWPTPAAYQINQALAEEMNNADKIVFSRTLHKADWINTRIVKGNIIEEMKKIKQTPGKDMTLLGSGTIINQFAEAGLIDEYQILIHPVFLAEGTPIFHGITKSPNLRLASSRIFKSGKVLLCYEPAAK
ncbi:MAG: dihydrofolate reductase family protein [Bacteroidota bacterium]|nr:dihydrofolate reductase family protein [Bacteroidota bacterium]